MSEPASHRPGLMAELRRRRVFRTLALYIVGAWVLMQVADVLFPALGIPETAIRYLLLATVVGFPVALVFGWMFDITAAGIHRTGRADAAEAGVVEPLRRADYLILGALLLVLGLIVYGTVGTLVELPSDTSDTPAAAARPPRGDGPPMVGVLPFTYRGSGDDAEFFASGVHDDLLTQMSKLSGLRVISRTSVLEYAGATKNIIDIGRELGADAILEGGVQVAGQRIRINAQLIDARTDEHLWAETYDRELTSTSIFDVQADIARAIAAEMQATLTEEEESELALIPTDNMAAYRAYHDGMRIREQGHYENRAATLAAFERAIELDPTFTRAMAEYVGALALKNFRINDPEEIAQIEAMIERIAAVAPDSVDHLMAQGFYAYYIVRDYPRARRLIGAAIARAPSDTRLLEINAFIARRMGDLEVWVDAARQLWKLEPTRQRWAGFLVWRLMIMHRYDEALVVAERVEDPEFALGLAHAELRLAKHHDPLRYRDEIRKLVERSGDGDLDGAFALMEAHLAVRDYAAIGDIIAELPEPAYDPDQPLAILPPKHTSQLLLGIATENRELLDRTLAEINRALGLDDDPLGERRARIHPNFLLIMAMASGSAEALLEVLDIYEAHMRDDLAESMGGQQEYCSALAQLGEAAKTVDCLRRAITQPSDVRPYLEPLYPFYDPVRDTPEFQQLLSDLAEQGYLEPQQQ